MVMESFFIYFCPFVTAVFAFVGDPEVFSMPSSKAAFVRFSELICSIGLPF